MDSGNGANTSNCSRCVQCTRRSPDDALQMPVRWMLLQTGQPCRHELRIPLAHLPILAIEILAQFLERRLDLLWLHPLYEAVLHHCLFSTPTVPGLCCTIVLRSILGGCQTRLRGLTEIFRGRISRKWQLNLRRLLHVAQKGRPKREKTQENWCIESRNGQKSKFTAHNRILQGQKTNSLLNM